MIDEFWLSTTDHTKIFVKRWIIKNKQPKAIVQLSHGMMEHIERYDHFAQYLVSKGIFVYGNDHRGHGQTGLKQGLLGYMADEDGFLKTANDLYEITKLIKQTYPETPIILFGHSMGSFLVRKYLQTYSREVDAVILSGTGNYPALVTTAGSLLASKLPAKQESELMNHLAFGQNNAKIKDQKTEFDWLSRDTEAVQAYIADPHTGFIPTARFFHQLMEGLKTIYHPEMNARISKELPMFIISGDADPVGDYGKGVWKTAKLYDQLGLKSVRVMLFEDGRHELLNEVNQAEVYNTIYNWIRNFI